ncbi:MAG: hypothetical protein BWX73_02239 [Lentisphaerae bacterium ADurb.Bin082]|nr:MAG: hypothetical protein BWX73_02239 [Lentisphaerae bacterium ADurb.Bin082]
MTDTAPLPPGSTVTDAAPLSPGFAISAVLCLAAAALADFLFYGQTIGWTLGFYAALLLATILWLDRSCALKHRATALLAVAIAGQIIAMFLRPSTLSVILTTLGLVSIASRRHLPWPLDTIDWLHRWLSFFLCGWMEIFLAARGRQGQPGVLGQKSRRTAVVLVKLLPIVVLAGLFVMLFAAANPLIERLLEQVMNGFDLWLGMITFPSVTRILFWLVVFVFAWALLHFCAKGRLLAESDPSLAVMAEFADFFLNPQTVTIGLVVFNAIFAVQNLLDIGYLWGGARLPEGMTYASYAHRGAYPLVATALLAAVLMLIVFRPSADQKQGRRNRVLVYIWVAQNILLTVSAAWRLNLYVSVYSLTRLRFAAAVWMLLVALGLVWICARIFARKSNQWLINANVLTLLAVLYVCAFVDVSGCVAHYNVRHCQEYCQVGPDLDFDYLNILGPSAMPALQWLEGQTEDDAFKYRVNATLLDLDEKLQAKLVNWRGWTLQRRRLDKIPVVAMNNPFAEQGEGEASDE